MLTDVATHALFTNTLGPRSTVIDLGAHRGEFASLIRERFGARVIAVEPDNAQMPAQVRQLGVEVVDAAVAGHDGLAVLSRATNPQASSIHVRHDKGEQLSVRCLTLQNLMKEMEVVAIDLLKVDIEGSEVAVFRSLADAELLAIPQVTVELHDFNGMITSDEAAEIIARMERLGFRKLQLSRTNHENILFYQPERIGVDRLQQCVAERVMWWWLGIKRLVRRWCETATRDVAG